MKSLTNRPQPPILGASEVTLARLRQVVNLQERDSSEIWLASESIELGDREKLQLEIIQS